MAIPIQPYTPGEKEIKGGKSGRISYVLTRGPPPPPAWEASVLQGYRCAEMEGVSISVMERHGWREDPPLPHPFIGGVRSGRGWLCVARLPVYRPPRGGLKIRLGLGGVRGGLKVGGLEVTG